MMKQHIRFAVVVSVMVLSVLACQVSGLTGVRGSGNVFEEVREVSGFTGVALAGIGELTIEVGERQSLRIEAEDNLMPYFETEVRNGVLEIGVEDRINLNPTRPVRFYLTVKELDKIVLSGSGDIKAPDLEAERFSVTISGSGNVEMGDLSADILNVTISGSGNLDIAGGQVEEQDITISGSGEYQAGDLSSESVEITISGSGNATIWATDSLDVRISGSGSVNYYGNPRTTFSGSGSGKVNGLGNP
ncbi:MAG: head GIN domain-containing protein [Anaerolineae bacterium]